MIPMPHTSLKPLKMGYFMFIQEVIIKQVKDGGGFFGIGADEVTDTSN